MQIFELHFNPLKKGAALLKTGEVPDLIFDSFCYNPENISEKRLGSLFMVGELQNALPQNLKFLDRLAGFLKKEYYSAPAKSSSETSLKRSLKNANEFLENFLKIGDVSWLGNLNLAVLTLKNFELNLAKVGTIKILLLRPGQIIDIGKNLEFSEIEPYPLRVFGNIVSGKLAENDIILVLTKDIFDFFSSQNLLSEIGNNFPFEERKLKNILNGKEKELSKISGVCLLCVLTKDSWPEKTAIGAISFQKEPEKFSLKKFFSPLLAGPKKFQQIYSGWRINLKEWLKKFAKPKTKTAVKIKKPKIKFPHFSIPRPKKNIVLIFFLIFFLAVGFLIFKRQEQVKLKRYQSTLLKIKEDVIKTQELLDYPLPTNEKKIFSLLKNSWQDLQPLINQKNKLQKEAESLNNSIEEKLEKISKLEKIPEPKILSEFEPTELNPHKIVYFGGNLYFFNPYADNILKLDKKGEKTLLQINQQFDEAVPFENALLFLKKPNLIFLLKNGKLAEPFSLKLPSPDFEISALSGYGENLYLFDKKSGEIIKYPSPIKKNKDFPQFWLKEGNQKATEANSMAVDGPIWILNKNNAISRYYRGNLQETLSLNFFPWPKDLVKAATFHDFIYILEPLQNRLIILTKTGSIIKQFQSEKFNNLRDFAISDDGRTIWLLNGSKVYEIVLE